MQLPPGGATVEVTVADPQKRFEIIQTLLIVYSMDFVHVPLNPSVFIHTLEGLI